MRGKSHLCIGKYLSERYLDNVSRHCVIAFQIGCLEPDRNPVTYLKGSVRHQWLRGHNYQNARRFMRTISRRLERKTVWNVFDYYTLGKLIHYTADAFTYAHNADFPSQLRSHREYETSLQACFLEYMAQNPVVKPQSARDIMSAISAYHRDYEQTESGIHRDCRFALTACCCVLTVLLTKSIL